MNLIADRWIAVRRASGARELIAPWQIAEADDPPVALDAQRPDFSNTLAQFLVGLLQTVCAPEDERRWQQSFVVPPAPNELCERFGVLAPAFELGGDGARFMQDADPHMSGVEVGVCSLLIDLPGDTDSRDNPNQFFRANLPRACCSACAAIALLTLQTHAPAGGRGHRTSLRGGGPLTTLLWLDPQSRDDGQAVSLWHSLWLNVLSRREFLAHWQGGDGPANWFPWLSATRTSEQGQMVTPADAHPAVAFWGTPRRIRFDFSALAHGTCDLCGVSSVALVQRYVTRHSGANYTGWVHPLSPYYRKQSDDTGWLPQHPQPGGIGYRHWLGLAYADANPLLKAAQTSARVPERTRRFTAPWQPKRPLQLWAAGFDMDNMKARCWYEARLPVYAIDSPERLQAFAQLVQQFVNAADLVRRYLTDAIRQAWFDRPEKARGDFDFIGQAFWTATETPFFAQVRALAEALGAAALTDAEGDALRRNARETWLGTVQGAAQRLFDQWAAGGTFEQEKPERIARAYNELRAKLLGQLLKSTLDLAPPPERKGKSARKAQRGETA